MSDEKRLKHGLNGLKDSTDKKSATSVPSEKSVMQTKDGYKQTKLGLIPEDWEVVHLEDIVDLRGRIGWKGLKTDDYIDEGPVLLGVKNITRSQRLDLTDVTHIPQEKYDESPEIMVRNGYLLLAKTGATIGKSCVVEGITEPTTVNAAVNVIECNGEVDNYFLNHFFATRGCQSQMWGAASPGAQPNLFQRDIKKLKIVLPPLPEQQKIAQILSTWDKAITKTEELIKQKQKRKQGLMQQLLTGKKRFNEFVKSDKMKETKLGWIPEDWEEVTFADIADKEVKWSITGGPFGSDLKSDDFTETGVRILQLQNLGDGRFIDNYKIYTSEKKADQLKACNIFPGELILSKMGDPVARACMIPNSEKRFLMASDGIRLVPDNSLFDNHFVLEYINYSIFRRLAIRHSTGSTRQRIGLSDLKKLPFVKPGLEEQRRISNVLGRADQEINKLQTQLDQLKNQKNGLMQKLLTGEVRVKMD